MPSIFKHNQRKRQSVDGDLETSATSSPIALEYEQSSNQIVGNTAFVSRRLSPPCRTDQILPPILEAAKKGDLQVVKDLLAETPEDLSVADTHGYTVLYYAVYSKNASLVKYLLEQKANYRHQAVRGITIFHYCISHGDETCFSLLCQYAQNGLLPPASPTQRIPQDISDNDGQTPLMLACRLGNDRIVRILLISGVNPLLRSFRGDNAFTIAIQCNAKECVKELTIACGFIDSRSKLYPHGALYTAARLNELAIVRHLVGYPEYVCQFISEMIRYPSRSEEIIVEVALREMASSLPQEVIEELSLLFIKNASLCMKLLFEVCKGRPHNHHYSLAGLAEVAKWCIKLSKVLTNSTIIADLDPYWRQIEFLVAQQSQKHCEQIMEESRVEMEGHQEIIEENGTPKITPNSSTKLLLSFLEIYVLGHYNLTTNLKEDKEESLHRLQSISCLHSRLLQFFSRYKEYLRMLVKADPAVYDMLHFFKHSFTLFLNNC